MSRSKDPTENIQPSSSGENTGERVPPSSPSASTEATRTYTQTTRPPSLNTKPSDKNGLTTPDNSRTTPITEKSRQTAIVAKVALKVLLSAGLIRRYEVRSPGSTTVTRIRYEFDTSIWTESLDLK